MKIAVYGTLRKDFNLNGYLSESKFLGEYRLKGFNLYISKDGIPVIKKGKGEVTAEVYEISEYLLNDLDIIEGVNTKRYKRETVKIENFEADVYVGNSLLKEDLIKIESGDYKEYYRNIYK